ncbi:MAG: transport system permease protein [Clostridiales bacterium]|jgi:ABC-2 type transport system permease protein|nr:transport system permease protein [Clostridiales bacterium]
MSSTLFKTTLKKNWTLLLIFFGVLTMYMTIMISMYDPEDMEALMSMFKLLPPDLMKALGFSSLATDLTAYLASWLYGLLMIAFPMIYSIILGNKLVAKMVDNGSFAYLLSTPNSRVKIITTQGLYALSTVLVLFSALFGLGVTVCGAMFPGALDITAFFRLNLTTMLVNMVVMMISFFFSCLFNETKMSLSFGAGIPIMFLLMNILGGASTNIEFLKKFSIYGIYDPIKLVHGSEVWGVNLFYIGIIVALFIASVFIFKKKRLPL